MRFGALHWCAAPFRLLQYKVFRQFGLTDLEIRCWFNGPAFLAWSRGQNEYGSGIAGPLPRSWMQSQWALQRQILARYRALGIVGQLPGFQGVVPAALASRHRDSNITVAGETGWMDSLDPFFGRIADVWMQTLLDDFGTDHWYQMDGLFDGTASPWMESTPDLMSGGVNGECASSLQADAREGSTRCVLDRG